jgi:catechol 2,3-dioxygenase-like lactoylglutathione lyase family enzyme
MAGSTTAGIPGIHHITAICGDPQRNLDFYMGLLGLRLVKKTVNFDDPGSYHLYYGDGLGSPGTIMTYYAWILPPTVTARARQGTGQITATPFSIPEASLDFWVDRLASAGVDFDGPGPRFGEPVISLVDPDGLPLELVARGGGTPRAPWREGPVPVEHAIRGFAGATLCLDGYERTAKLLTETMGFREAGQEGSRFRFQVGEGDDAAMVDLHCQPEGDPGRMGIGAVHHIAWRAPSAELQREWRRVLAAAGLDVTPVLDRNYFESIYYREPGGVLFEIATDPPGFTVDESPEELGTHLKLPPWLEPRRERLEARLPELRTPAATRRSGDSDG